MYLRHRAYPLDALIRARVVLRNTTHHIIWIEGYGPEAPGRYIPQVQVLDDSGRSLPISLTTWFPYPGPMPSPVRLQPGQAITGGEYLVLRGARVRLAATLLPNGNVPVRSGTPLHTRALRLHLLPADPPTVRINSGASSPSITIIRPAQAHRSPRAVWYADCGGTNFDQTIYWSKVSTHLVPRCSPLHAWHVLAGWQGHSVATVELPVS